MGLSDNLILLLSLLTAVLHSESLVSGPCPSACIPKKQHTVSERDPVPEMCAVCGILKLMKRVKKQSNSQLKL